MQALYNLKNTAREVAAVMKSHLNQNRSLRNLAEQDNARLVALIGEAH
jgi:hypothetical protein